ncbi:hypothetical protein C8J95_10616 [Elizabethkingia sp. YR214]|uniref:hypothetical protein n=1 Tax=Elizabethkingia sp. YR214 TaxID=2135667 RepID=UPI000D3275E3|nr:hypothetical protein [Elizabethkingia sp. YR214]PUB29365.1 hypothetical protein C8J95_10616 [Elizabethkingia sp. YR214]
MKKLILLATTVVLLFSNIGCREAEELGTIGSTQNNNTASANDTKLTNDSIIKNLKDQAVPEKKKTNPISETAESSDTPPIKDKIRY